MNPTSRIFIVDDEVRMCESLQVLLQEGGYIAEAALSGAQALAAIGAKQYDLFLVDINMPEMDGFSLLEELLHRQPGVPVVMITGNASIESAVKSLKKGAYDYLKKPFGYEDLIKTVKNALAQKKLKDECQMINGKLNESEARYRFLVQNSPDIIFTLDPQGNFTFVSDAVQRLLGYQSKTLVGMPYTTFLVPEDREKAKWIFNERRTGERASSGVELHFFINPESDIGMQREADFLTVELESTGMYQEGVLGQEKTHTGTYAVARDISYRKQLEAELRQAQKMKAVGTLAGGIAHDFNNLLMVIQGYTSLMMGSVDLNHPNYKKLKSIEHHVQSGAELTRQLLGFARTGKYNVQAININNLVHKTASMFGRTRKEIRLHTKYQKDLWTAELDEGQIEQVLLNLYLNACQAMPGGGDIFIETENVAISAVKGRHLGLNPGNYIRLGVRDTGIGMEPETLQRIFEPFFTTKERFCGTGLGLASAYGIIDNHGGAIKASSRKGAGSVFQLYLPASQKKATDNIVDPEKVVSGQGTVLLVDDEVTIIDVTREMLQRLGYQVISAAGGKEAITLFETNQGRIDLVILDMIMPGMSGGETFDQIRRIKPEVYVLLSSGYSMKGEAEKILRRGCNGFIQKPYRLEQLSEKISEIFKRKKIRNAN